MAVKTSLIAAVATMETVDMSITRMAFPGGYEHDSQKVEFDVYEGGSEIALKGNFEKQSNIVNKDGYKTITVNPMQVNESIVDSVKNVNKKRIGQTVYGELAQGMSEAEIAALENDMKGFGKLKKRAQRLIKKSAYDVLTTGKLTVSGQGDAVDEIDFGLTNKIVNDISTSGQIEWNDANSNPIEQLEIEAEKMGQHAVDTYVLGMEAKKAFMSNANVRTTDNTTNGKKANFIQATKEEREAKSTEYFKYLGSTTGDYGKPVEIYYEFEQYVDASKTEQYYLDKNYAVGFKARNEENGQVQYGNIPVATGSDENSELTTVVGMEWIDAEIKKDPAGVKRYYRSSPLPTMNQPKAFISIKATLVA
jgi:hypothetical protein